MLARLAYSISSHLNNVCGSVCLCQGALVANYPWDGTHNRTRHYAASPDDATYRHLASAYANAHATMNTSKEFAGGITNGAAWYPLWGGMQVRVTVYL